MQCFVLPIQNYRFWIRVPCVLAFISVSCILGVNLAPKLRDIWHSIARTEIAKVVHIGLLK
jgi:hypothetical protein